MEKTSAVTYVFSETDLIALIKKHLVDVEGESGEIETYVDVGSQSVGHGPMERNQVVFRGIKATVKNHD